MQTAYDLAKRNYGRTWTIEMLQNLVNKNKLSVEQYVELTQQSTEDLIDSIDNIKAYKLNELSEICEQTILDGIDVETSQGIEHFSLTIYDQLEIKTLYDAIQNGATQVQYHADDEMCRWFTAEEIINIYNLSMLHIAYNKTYFNHLKIWVLRTGTVEDVNLITWRTPLPEDLDVSLIDLTGKSSIE